MAIFILAIVMMCSTGSAVFAQIDYDFPPAGFLFPCCSKGGTGGYTGATFGKNGQSAWRQVWGAAPGDVVTFQFELRAISAGSLHAWPQSTDGAEMTYLGDQNNQYEHWGYNTFGRRDKGGDFCISCPWRFTANTWNPWIYVNYWDSGDGWDVDLNVTSISTPPQRRLYTAEQKDSARLWSGIVGTKIKY